MNKIHSSDFNERFKDSEPILLDGGMGRYLKKLTPYDPELWSASNIVNETYHKYVVQAHLDFLNAGAEVITTNNFTCVPYYLKFKNLEGKYAEYNAISGQLAQQAKKKFMDDPQHHRPVFVAGSLPTLSECYHYDSNLIFNESLEIYRTMIKSLDPYVDFYIIETIIQSEEAIAALQAASEVSPKKIIFCSFSVDASGKLRGGESIEEAIEKIEKAQNPTGYMLNCSPPDEILEGLKHLTVSTDKWIGAYMNNFKMIDINVDLRFRKPFESANIDSFHFIEYLKKYLKHKNMKIIGGCCEIDPEHIQAARKALDSHILEYS